MARLGKRIDRWERPADMAHGAGCYVLDCGRKVIAKGMCWTHYQRARRGLPVFVFLRQSSAGKKMVEVEFGPPKPPKRALRMNRFAWELVTNITPEPTTGCYLWLGEIHPSGYGLIGRQGDPWGRWAHRAVLYFNGVAIERGNSRLHVRHLCDNRACVNPAHLAYGSAKQNMADRERRYARGEMARPGVFRGPRKMSASLIAYAWAAHDAGVSVAELARDLGLNWQTVNNAIRGAGPQLQQRAA